MSIDIALYQFGDIGIGNILWFLFIMIFFMFYSKIIVFQMIMKLEQSAQMLEGLTRKGKNIVIKKMAKKPSKELKDAINNFLNVLKHLMKKIVKDVPFGNKLIFFI